MTMQDTNTDIDAPVWYQINTGIHPEIKDALEPKEEYNVDTTDI